MSLSLSLSFSAFDASYSLLSYFLPIFLVLLLYLVLRINIPSYFLSESSTIDLLSLSLLLGLDSIILNIHNVGNIA